MTGTTTWAEQRERATHLFGNTTPNPNDERTIAAAFTEHPAAIIAEITQLAHAYTAGRIHTPWRALAAKLPKLAVDTATVNVNRDLRTRQAETWIRNAGIYCPDEHEIRDELFHATSALLAGLEHELGPAMLTLYRAERPRGLRSEADATERAHRIRDARQPKPPAEPAPAPDEPHFGP